MNFVAEKQLTHKRPLDHAGLATTLDVDTLHVSFSLVNISPHCFYDMT